MDYLSVIIGLTISIAILFPDNMGKTIAEGVKAYQIEMMKVDKPLNK